MKTRAIAWMGCGLVALCAGCGGPADLDEHRAAATHMARQIEHDVEAIEAATRLLAQATAEAYNLEPVMGDTNRYRLTPEGCLYKAVADGGPALWVSGVVPVDESIIRLAWATESIDDELMAIPRQLPAVAQAYYNDRHSLNRIYPPFDVLSQYEPGMDIPTFNFYYLADARHNPERNVVWVNEPYVDPAGRGWMISCIAPVYHHDELMGVVGLDVTVAGIVEHYLQPANAAWALLDASGTIVAATEPAIEQLDMPPLTDHRYINTVKSDRYRSEDYNVLQSPNVAVRQLAQQLAGQAPGTAWLRTKGRRRVVIAEPVPSLNWTILRITD